MGIFKSIKGLKQLAEQAKGLRAEQLQRAGYEPNTKGGLQQLNDMVGQVSDQLGVLGAFEQDRGRVMSDGVEGTGTIVGMGVPPRSATWFNLLIDLEVRIDGWDAYRVANQYMVPGSAQLGIGVSLPIKVDPDDRAKIAIDWDRASHRPTPGEIRPVD